jgi:hypothetical protein
MRKALGWAVVGATAAAGVLSVSATANAATFPQRHKAPTTLSVRESAPVIRSHHKDTSTGKLAEGRKPLARESVTVTVVEGRRLVPAGTARTDRFGDVSFTVAPKGTTTYQLVFTGTGTLAASKSHTVTVRVVR